MNYSMFIPQVDETDIYDKNGNQVDDINSLVEYIDQIVLGNVDPTPEDEDDDNACYFHVIKIDPSIKPQFSESETKPDLPLSAIEYPLIKEEKLPEVYFRVTKPPPRA